MGRKNRERRPKVAPQEDAPQRQNEAISHTSTRRVFLFLSAFLSGAAIMIVELAGNRVLAPWFGNSLFAWTGLIGVVLTSISCGYYVGGYLADRFPSWPVLSHILAIAAVLTMLVPFLQSLLESLMNPMDLVWGPIIASLCLFALPGIALGSVSPFAVRLASLLSQDRHIGISAGRIGMLATLGSVMGTFATGFVLIPHLSLRWLFFVTSSGLAALAVVGYLLFQTDAKRKTALLFTLLLLMSVSGALAIQAATPKTTGSLLFERTTFYHRIRVIETAYPDGNAMRTLYLDSTVEGGQFTNTRELPIRYQRFWELTRAFAPELKRAAFLGGGGYAMPEALLDAYPEATVDVVELDPEVIEVGRTFFRTGEYPNLYPIAGDARRFLRRTNERYDLVFGDTYNGVRYIPAHLVTREFFEVVRSRLRPKGVFMMNIISAASGRNASLFFSVSKTLSDVFNHVHAFANEPRTLDKSQNIILVATDENMPVVSLLRDADVNRVTRQTFAAAYLGTAPFGENKGMVFTDDLNPVEYLVTRSMLYDR